MRLQILLAILITGLIGCHRKQNEINISGKIVGDIPELIEYTVPVNGITYFGFEESIQPDSSGNFEISIPVDKACFIEFSAGRGAYGTIIVEPGRSYRVFIDTESQENVFRVECENREGQALYNQLTSRSMITEDFEMEAMKFLNDTSVLKIKQRIHDIEAIEMAGFRDLLDNKVISEDFFNLVENDRAYFYDGALSTIGLLKFLFNSKKDTVRNAEEFKTMWGELYQDRPVTDPDLLRSPWFFYYVENYLRFKEYTVASFSIDTLTELNEKGLTHTHKIKMAKQLLSEPVLEYYYATYIYFVSAHEEYLLELLTLFEQFNQDYPSSQYTRFLEPEIIKIMAFHNIEGQPFNEDILFIDDAENINALEALAELWKGKKIYVDVWATWCVSCKKEFK